MFELSLNNSLTTASVCFATAPQPGLHAKESVSTARWVEAVFLPGNAAARLASWLIKTDLHTRRLPIWSRSHTPSTGYACAVPNSSSRLWRCTEAAARRRTAHTGWVGTVRSGCLFPRMLLASAPREGDDEYPFNWSVFRTGVTRRCRSRRDKALSRLIPLAAMPPLRRIARVPACLLRCRQPASSSSYRGFPCPTWLVP